jgi:hypothetical protein
MERAGHHSRPSSAIRLRPKIMERTATSDRAALLRSSRPASGSRNSGSSTGPSTRRSSITGTPIRNTEPHQKYCRRIPPRSGPITAPTE